MEHLAAELYAQAKSMYADRESCRQDLADLIRQETIDAEEVDRRLDEKLDRMREMAEFAVQRLITFHSQLTPE